MADEREDRVEAAIAEFMQAADADTPLDRAAWLDKHPDLRAELEQFLADQSAFRNLVRPNEQLTLPLRDSSVDGAHPVVRYFGDYELLEEIARGGMGVVYKARQVSLNRLVAVKMILAGNLASASDIQRFRSEAESAANLDHANILPIYEVGEHEGQHYFSMKLVTGGSLSQQVAKLVDDPRAAVKLLAEVARAVHFAHQRGIIHRDLKPANVLLDRDQRPLVTDFGLAKRTSDASDLTQSGAIVGTPSYMAPEQAAGKKGTVTVATDVWALGAILYELLTGRPPFRAETPLDTMLQALDREPEPPSKLKPNVDRDLEAVCLKCLTKDPVKRYATAAAFADDLDHWLAGEPLSVRPASMARQILQWLRQNVRAAAWIIVIGLLCGVIAPLGIASEMLRPLPQEAAESYARSPQMGKPWIAYLDFRMHGLILFFWLPITAGVAVQWLVRTKDSWSDALVGLATAVLAGVTAFILILAPASAASQSFQKRWHVPVTVVPWPSLKVVTSDLTAPDSTKTGNLLRDRPDLVALPEKDRLEAIQSRERLDAALAIVRSIWWAAATAFSGFVMGCMAGALIAGFSRRTPKAWKLRSIGSQNDWLWYLLTGELFLTGFPLVLMPETVWHAFASGLVELPPLSGLVPYWVAWLVAMMGLARGWPIPVRYALYSFNYLIAKIMAGGVAVLSLPIDAVIVGLILALIAIQMRRRSAARRRAIPLVGGSMNRV